MPVLSTDLKYNAALQAGKESMARYIMNTHPSWEAAWYTVNILVAGIQISSLTYIPETKYQSNHVFLAYIITSPV